MAEVIVHQSDEENVRIIDVAEGCLAFRGPGDGNVENMSLVLMQAVQDWRRRHPQMRVISITPFVLKGNTVGFDLWYDAWITPKEPNGSRVTLTYESRQA